MRKATRGALCALAFSLAGWASPTTASAAAPATIIPEHPDRACVGETAVLMWTPPDIDGIAAYQITRSNYSPFGPQTITTIVGAGQHSLGFTVSFFTNTFLIRAVTSTGMIYEPFASATIIGNQAPQPMQWDHHTDPEDVGDGTALVRFAWPGPVTTFTVGGVLPVTVRVTAEPGGATNDVPASANGVVTRFTELTNGVNYSFSALTANACGSSESEPSATYVPGVVPTWVEASPPLTVKKKETYSYQFTASGDPAPTYALVGAPEWLAVAHDGRVSGDPPKSTTSFSYSVVAQNGVGIGHPWSLSPIVAGPLTVTVTKGRPELAHRLGPEGPLRLSSRGGGRPKKGL